MIREMKQGKKINNWEPQTYELFREAWACWNCDRNTRDCGHHIFGRGKEEGCEKSPLNFAPLCNFKCHLPRHGYWVSLKGQRVLFQKTLDYLAKIGYVLIERDLLFLETYKERINKLKIV